MYGLALEWMVHILLMHNYNDISALSSCYSTGRYDRNQRNFMVINATNVNVSVWVSCNDPRIRACNASIGASIDKGSPFLSPGCSQNIVRDVVYVRQSIFPSVDSYLISLFL
jgi:hypothetical protein